MKMIEDRNQNEDKIVKMNIETKKESTNMKIFSQVMDIAC